MTVRELYNNVLVELNKVQAPSLLLEDFVYLVNKAVQKYINKRYNFFEMNQQLTDDLRVLLKSSKALVESTELFRKGKYKQSMDLSLKAISKIDDTVYSRFGLEE